MRFKRAALVWAAVMVCCSTVLANALPPNLQRIEQVWPSKATWIGQQATLLPAKMYATASYLLLYEQPGTELSGIDQLTLARKDANHTYILEGLYCLPGRLSPGYYWHLKAPTGASDLWVKDTVSGRLDALPFGLPGEFDEEATRITELRALAGSTVWLNRNRVEANELSPVFPHLTPLTVTELITSGPFAEAYGFNFTAPDGTKVEWRIGPKTTRPAYNHTQFRELFRQSFWSSDPRNLHPLWPDEVWSKIATRTVAVGWNEEMVRLSWGDPETIDKSQKEYLIWKYPHNYQLLFRNGSVYSITVPSQGKEPPAATAHPKSPVAKPQNQEVPSASRP